MCPYSSWMNRSNHISWTWTLFLLPVHWISSKFQKWISTLFFIDLMLLTKHILCCSLNAQSFDWLFARYQQRKQTYVSIKWIHIFMRVGECRLTFGACQRFDTILEVVCWHYERDLENIYLYFKKTFVINESSSNKYNGEYTSNVW